MLADKEVLLTALNIKAMTFTGLDQDESETEEEDEDEIKANGTAGQCKKQFAILLKVKVHCTVGQCKTNSVIFKSIFFSIYII